MGGGAGASPSCPHPGRPQEAAGSPHGSACTGRGGRRVDNGRSASPSVSGTWGCHTDLGLNFGVLGSVRWPGQEKNLLGPPEPHPVQKAGSSSQRGSHWTGSEGSGSWPPWAPVHAPDFGELVGHILRSQECLLGLAQVRLLLWEFPLRPVSPTIGVVCDPPPGPWLPHATHGWG